MSLDFTFATDPEPEAAPESLPYEKQRFGILTTRQLMEDQELLSAVKDQDPAKVKDITAEQFRGLQGRIRKAVDNRSITSKEANEELKLAVQARHQLVNASGDKEFTDNIKYAGLVDDLNQGIKERTLYEDIVPSATKNLRGQFSSVLDEFSSDEEQRDLEAGGGTSADKKSRTVSDRAADRIKDQNLFNVSSLLGESMLDDSTLMKSESYARLKSKTDKLGKSVDEFLTENLREGETLNSVKAIYRDEVFKSRIEEVAKEKGTSYEDELANIVSRVKENVLEDPSSLNKDKQVGDIVYSIQSKQIAPGVNMTGDVITFSQPEDKESARKLISYLRDSDEFARDISKAEIDGKKLSDADFANSMLSFSEGKNASIDVLYDQFSTAEEEAFGGNDFHDYYIEKNKELKKSQGKDYDEREAKNKITVDFLEEQIDAGFFAKSFDFVDKVLFEKTYSGIAKGSAGILLAASSNVGYFTEAITLGHQSEESFNASNNNIVTKILSQGIEDLNEVSSARSSMLGITHGRTAKFLGDLTEVGGMMVPNIALGIATGGAGNVAAAAARLKLAKSAASIATAQKALDVAVKTSKLASNAAQGILAGATVQGLNSVDFYGQLVKQAQDKGLEVTQEMKDGFRSKSNEMALPGAIATAAITFAGAQWMNTLEGKIVNQFSAGSVTKTNNNLALALGSFSGRKELLNRAKALINNKSTLKGITDRVRANSPGLTATLGKGAHHLVKGAASEGFEEGLAGGAEAILNAAMANAEGLRESASLNDFVKGFIDEGVVGVALGGGLPGIKGGTAEIYNAIRQSAETKSSVSGLLRANSAIKGIIENGASILDQDINAVRATQQGRELLDSVKHTYAASKVEGGLEKLAEAQANVAYDRKSSAQLSKVSSQFDSDELAAKSVLDNKKSSLREVAEAKQSIVKARQGKALVSLSQGKPPSDLNEGEIESLGFNYSEDGNHTPKSVKQLKEAGMDEPLISIDKENNIVYTDAGKESMKALKGTGRGADALLKSFEKPSDNKKGKVGKATEDFDAKSKQSNRFKELLGEVDFSHTVKARNSIGEAVQRAYKKANSASTKSERDTALADIDVLIEGQTQRMDYHNSGKKHSKPETANIIAKDIIRLKKFKERVLAKYKNNKPKAEKLADSKPTKSTSAQKSGETPKPKEESNPEKLKQYPKVNSLKFDDRSVAANQARRLRQKNKNIIYKVVEDGDVWKIVSSDRSESGDPGKDSPSSENPSKNSKEENQSTPFTINIWSGTKENAHLSNLSLRQFTYEGREYNSVEHAYQSNKSGKFNEKVYNADWSKPRKVMAPKNVDKSISDRLMENLIFQSFSQNPDAAASLLATGNTPLTHKQDKGYWGKAFPRILMEVRSEIRASVQPESETKLSSPSTGLNITEFSNNPSFNNDMSLGGRVKDNLTPEEKVAVTRYNELSDIKNSLLYGSYSKVNKVFMEESYGDSDVDVEFIESKMKELDDSFNITGNLIAKPSDMAGTNLAAVDVLAAIKSKLPNTILGDSTLEKLGIGIEFTDEAGGDFISSPGVHGINVSFKVVDDKLVVNFGYNSQSDIADSPELLDKIIAEESHHVATMVSFINDQSGTTAEKTEAAIKEIRELGDEILSDPKKAEYANAGYFGYDVDNNLNGEFSDSFQAAIEYLNLIDSRARTGESVGDLTSLLLKNKSAGFINTARRWFQAAKRALQALLDIKADPEVASRLDKVNEILNLADGWHEFAEAKAKEAMRESTAIDDRLTEFLSKEAVPEFVPQANPSITLDNDTAADRLGNLSAFASASKVLAGNVRPLTKVNGEYKLALTEKSLPESSEDSKKFYSVSEFVSPPSYIEALQAVRWLNTPAGRRTMETKSKRVLVGFDASVQQIETTIGDIINEQTHPMEYLRSLVDDADPLLEDMSNAITLNNLTSDRIVYGLIKPKSSSLGLNNELALDFIKANPDVNWGVPLHSNTHVVTRMIDRYLNPDADMSTIMGSLFNQSKTFNSTIPVPLGSDFNELMKLLTNEDYYIGLVSSFSNPKAIQGIFNLREKAIVKYGKNSEISANPNDLPQAILLMAGKIDNFGDGFSLNLHPLSNVYKDEKGKINSSDLRKEQNIILDNMANSVAVKTYMDYADGIISSDDRNDFTLSHLPKVLGFLTKGNLRQFIEDDSGELPAHYKINEGLLAYPNRPAKYMNNVGILRALIPYIDQVNKNIPAGHPAKTWVEKSVKATSNAGNRLKQSDNAGDTAWSMLQEALAPLGYASSLIEKTKREMDNILTDAKWSDKSNLALIDDIIDASLFAKLEKGALSGTGKKAGFIYDVEPSTEALLKKTNVLKEADWDEFAIRLKSLTDLDDSMSDGKSVDTTKAVSLLDGETGTETMMNRDVLSARALAESVNLEDFINKKIRKSVRKDKTVRSILLLQAVGGDLMKARQLVAKHLNKQNLDHASIHEEVMHLLIAKIRKEHTANYFSAKNKAKRLLMSATVRPYIDEPGGKRFASLAGTFMISDKYMDILADLPDYDIVGTRDDFGQIDIKNPDGSINPQLASVEASRRRRLTDGRSSSQRKAAKAKGRLARYNDVKRKIAAFNEAAEAKLQENMQKLHGIIEADFQELSERLAKLEVQKSKPSQRNGPTNVSIINKQIKILKKDLILTEKNQKFFKKFDKVESRNVSLARLSPGQYRKFASAIADSDSTTFDRAKFVGLSNRLSASLNGLDPDAVALPNPLIDKFFDANPDMPVITYNGNELWKSGNQDFGQGVLLDQDGKAVAVILNGGDSQNSDSSERLLAKQIVDHQIHNGLKRVSDQFKAVMSDFRVALLDMENGGEVTKVERSELTGRVITRTNFNTESKTNMVKLLSDMNLTTISEASDSQIITAMMSNPNMHLVLASMDEAVINELVESLGDRYLYKEGFDGFSRFFDKLGGEFVMSIGSETYFEDSADGADVDVPEDRADGALLDSEDGLLVDEDEYEGEVQNTSSVTPKNENGVENLFARLMYEVWFNLESEPHPETSKLMDFSDKMDEFDALHKRTWADLIKEKQELDSVFSLGDMKTVYLGDFLGHNVSIHALNQNLDARNHFSKIYNFLSPNLSYQEKHEARAIISRIRDIGNSGHTIRAYAEFFSFFKSTPSEGKSWFVDDAELSSAEFSIVAVALQEADLSAKAINSKTKVNANGQKITELQKAEEDLNSNISAIAEIDAEFQRRTNKEISSDSVSKVFWSARKARTSKGDSNMVRSWKGDYYNTTTSPVLINDALIDTATKIAGQPVSGMAVVLGSTIANRARMILDANNALSSVIFGRSIVDGNLASVSSAIDSQKLAEVSKDAFRLVSQMETSDTAGYFAETSSLVGNIITQLRHVMLLAGPTDDFQLVDTGGLYNSMVALENSMAWASPANLIARIHNDLNGVGSSYSYDQIRRYSPDAILNKAEQLYADSTGASFSSSSYDDFVAPISKTDKPTDKVSPDLFQQRKSLELKQSRLASKVASLRALESDYNNLRVDASIEDLLKNKLVSHSLQEMFRNFLNRVHSMQFLSKSNSHFSRKRAVKQSFLAKQFLEGNFTDDDLVKAEKFVRKINAVDGGLAKDLDSIQPFSRNLRKMSDKSAMGNSVTFTPKLGAPSISGQGVGQVEKPSSLAQSVRNFDGDLVLFNESGSMLPSMNFESNDQSKELSDSIIKALITNNATMNSAYEASISDSPSKAAVSIVSQNQAIINNLTSIYKNDNVSDSLKSLAHNALVSYAEGDMKTGSKGFHQVFAVVLKSDFVDVVAASGAKGKKAWKVLKSETLGHDAQVFTKFASSHTARVLASNVISSVDVGIDGKSGRNGAEAMSDHYVNKINVAAKALSPDQTYEVSVVGGMLNYSLKTNDSPLKQISKFRNAYATSIDKMKNEAKQMDVSDKYKSEANAQAKVLEATLAKFDAAIENNKTNTDTISFYAAVEAEIMSGLTADQVNFIKASREVFAEIKPAVATSMASKGRAIGEWESYTPITSYTDDQMQNGDFEAVLTSLPEGSYARQRFGGDENTAINLNAVSTYASSIKTMLYGVNANSAYSLIGDVFGNNPKTTQDVAVPIINQATSTNGIVDDSVADAAKFISGIVNQRYDNDHPPIRHAGGWERGFLSVAETGMQMGLISKWQATQQTIAPSLTYMSKNLLSIPSFVSNLAGGVLNGGRINEAMSEYEPSIGKRGYDGGNANVVPRMWKDWKYYGGLKKTLTAAGLPFSVAKSMGIWALNKLVGYSDGVMIKAIIATEYKKRTGREFVDDHGSNNVDHSEFIKSRLRGEGLLATSDDSTKAKVLQGYDNAALNVISKIASSYSTHQISLAGRARAGLSLIRRGDTAKDKIEGLSMLTDYLMQNAIFMLSKPAGLALMYGLIAGGDDEDEKKKEQEALNFFSDYLGDPERKAKTDEAYFAHFAANQVTAAVGAVLPGTALNLPNSLLNTGVKFGTEKLTGETLLYDGFTNEGIKDPLSLMGAAGTAAINYINVIESYTLDRNENANLTWKDAAHIMLLLGGDRDSRNRIRNDVNEHRDVPLYKEEKFGKLKRRNKSSSGRKPWEKEDDGKANSKPFTKEQKVYSDKKLDNSGVLSGSSKSFPLQSILDRSVRPVQESKDYNLRYGNKVSDQSNNELSLVNLRSKEFSTLGDNKATYHKDNDGDSFYIMNDGKRIEMRLYHVDTAEKLYKTYGKDKNGNLKSNAGRVRNQMKYFGISQENAFKLGSIAAEFTSKLMRDNEFMISTRYDDVFTPGRKYAYVTVKYEGKEVYLHELLVSKGLVRINSSPDTRDVDGVGRKVGDGDQFKANLPDGSSYASHIRKLKRMESRAKADKLGGWGMRN